jgi:hypothetical protein
VEPAGIEPATSCLLLGGPSAYSDLPLLCGKGNGASALLGETGRKAARIVPSAYNCTRPIPRTRTGQQCPFVLEPAELTLDATALPVELLVPLRFARDERMQAVGSLSVAA